MIVTENQQTTYEEKDRFSEEIDIPHVPAEQKSASHKSLIQITQEKEINQLEEEIKRLEKLLKQRKELLNKHFEKKHNVDKSPKTVEDYKEECEDIQRKIELTTKLAGISIQELTHNPLKSGDIVQYNLKGQCMDISFKVEFECLETNEDDNSLKITKLDIYVPENIQDELQKCLISMSEDRSIWKFFQLIVPYSRWHRQRIKTFQHFVEKYPDSVKVEEESFIPYLIIKNNTLTQGPVFCISWKFEVDQVYRAKSRLTLSMKIPDYIQQQDKDQTLKRSSERFEDTVEELGIEHAIETIIKLASLCKNTDISTL